MSILDRNPRQVNPRRDDYGAAGVRTAKPTPKRPFGEGLIEPTAPNMLPADARIIALIRPLCEREEFYLSPSAWISKVDGRAITFQEVNGLFNNGRVAILANRKAPTEPKVMPKVEDGPSDADRAEWAQMTLSTAAPGSYFVQGERHRKIGSRHPLQNHLAPGQIPQTGQVEGTTREDARKAEAEQFRYWAKRRAERRAADRGERAAPAPAARRQVSPPPRTWRDDMYSLIESIRPTGQWTNTSAWDEFHHRSELIERSFSAMFA